MTKKVLLIGINGVYNYGCEAIVRGTVNILKQYNPALDVYYASYNYEDDVRRLSGCEVNILKRPPRRRWSYQNIKRKFLSYMRIRYEVPYDSDGWTEKFDCIFSVGGDIYTLNPQKGYNSSLAVFCEKCQQRGIPYVLWGASVGPFDANPAAYSFYKRHLSKASLIVAREKVTVAYLRSMEITENVVLAPDPAFFVAPEKKPEKVITVTSRVIGINLSPLSGLFRYSCLEEALKKQAKVVEALLREGKRILFLPHVLSDTYSDNDLWYLTCLYDSIPEEYRPGIEVVNTDPGFVGIKERMLECDVVIAARMHCAINAVSAGVPVLFLSYSAKAKGMAEYVYGSEKRVIDLEQFENIPEWIELLGDLSVRPDLEKLRSYDFSGLFRRLNL